MRENSALMLGDKEAKNKQKKMCNPTSEYRHGQETGSKHSFSDAL